MHSPPQQSRKPICCDHGTSCFIPPAIQSCCASVVESSFVQSALAISHLLSDLLQSADIYPHICITAKASLVPPHRPCWLCGGRRRLTSFAHEYCYHYLFHYSRNPHASAISLYRSVSTFLPSPHDRHLSTVDRTRPPPPAPHHRNHPHLFVSPPLQSLSSLNYVPAASFRPSPRQYFAHFGPP
jgi:hypothetical protein